MAISLHPTLNNLEEEKDALFIARLAKRGACLTEGETANDGVKPSPI